MKEQLISVIESLKADRKITLLDKSETKHSVILRLLTLLGWDIFNVEEVVIQDWACGGAEYHLNITGENTVFIEFSKGRRELRDEYRTSSSTITLHVKTDGITWWFFMPLRNGSRDEKSFYTIDILYQNPEDVASRFIDFLSRENVVSNNVFINAEAISKSEQGNLIAETLPKAWNSIIEDTDMTLIELIINRAERICGYKGSAEMVEQFLHEHKANLRISELSARAQDFALTMALSPSFKRN